MMELAVIDFETTGVDPAADEILQVAVIDGRGQVLLNELCRPQRVGDWAGAQRVNGITPAMVAGKPAFAHFAPRVQELLAGAKRVLAYNAAFEQGFLRAAGIDPDAFRWADPMELFARAFGGQKRRLSTAAGLFGIRFQAHDALGDVQATLALYRALQQGVLRRIVENAGDAVLTDGARTVHCRAPGTPEDWLYAHKALGLCPLTAAEPRALVYNGLSSGGPVPCSLLGFEDRSADGDWLVAWVRADGRLIALDSDHLKEMQAAAYTPPDRPRRRDAAPRAGDAAGGAPAQLTMEALAGG